MRAQALDYTEDYIVVTTMKRRLAPIYSKEFWDNPIRTPWPPPRVAESERPSELPSERPSEYYTCRCPDCAALAKLGKPNPAPTQFYGVSLTCLCGVPAKKRVITDLPGGMVDDFGVHARGAGGCASLRQKHLP